MQAAPNGDLLYANIDLPGRTSTTGSIGIRRSDDSLWALLDASFLRLWPRERAAVEDLVETAQPYAFMGKVRTPRDEEDQYSTHDVRTNTASWSLWSFYDGDPRALRIRTANLRARTWPFDGSHYATSVSAATDRLTADGFSCSTSCYRAEDNQSVDFDSHDDQIVSIRFTLRTRADGDRVADPSGTWVRAGLPFLTPAVRTAVGRRIEKSRLDEKNWHGVVAGTPVDIIAGKGASSMPDDQLAHDLTVVIGIPLLIVE